jgi:cation transport ATPase
MMVVTFGASSQEKKNKNAKYDIEVNGNCEQCKKRIEKAAYSVSGVKSAVWHIDDHKLHLIINEEKTSLAEVKKAVAKVGHDTDDVKATDAAYENLHHCCKYERK